MSWQLGAFLVLAVGLVAGFAWYERTKPDAKLVALVGSLAALAAVGRVAFAAVPNVKPTTDIVLISGFALGGAPGFVVGATAALTSNFFFGQGPWTPWQMAGWGATGLIGAVLARANRGRIGRRSLAAVCFVVGFAFTAFQDFGDWVTYSDHSLGQLGVYVGKGLGFDLVHAVSCVAFALLFGPALNRSLSRFRERMNVRWRPIDSHIATPLTLFIAVVAGGAGVMARPAASDAATQTHTPVGYLRAAENRDGGWGAAEGQQSAPLYSAWATLALAAAGGHTGPGLKYVESHPGGHDAGDLERSILAAAAAGAVPTRQPVRGWLTDLEKDVRPNGSVSDQTNLTTFAVLAQRAVGRRPAAATVAWLVAQQDRDGGFNWDKRGAPSDVDDTGAALEALSGTGHARAINHGVKFIEDQQNRDGGFGAEKGAASDSQSTAFAIQGLIATHVNPGGLHRKGARSPVVYLRLRVRPNGAVAYAKGNHQSPVWVTAEAELALAGKPLPFHPGRLVSSPSSAARNSG